MFFNIHNNIFKGIFPWMFPSQYRGCEKLRVMAEVYCRHTVKLQNTGACWRQTNKGEEVLQYLFPSFHHTLAKKLSTVTSVGIVFSSAMPDLLSSEQKN
jgi:hypothetical protein